MWSGSALVLLCGVWTVNAEINSLTYIYTAFTRPVGLPGIHEFSAIGLLDGRPIDYFDSDTQVKVPREDWMKERLDKEYWDKGTSSRQTKQQWFKVSLKVLNDRLRKNDTVNHYLQWRHGCEVNTTGSERKLSGIDQYGYDGDDFLSFDSHHKQWVAHMDGAILTKRKWDGIQQLNDYTDGYLHNECVQWLDTFLKYRKEANIKASPPEVYISARPFENNLKLSCLATGFHPKEITMNIRRDGHLVDRDDGLQSTGIRPNGDGTHQIKKWVMIPRGDTANYTCEVNHPASNIHVVEEWGKSLACGVRVLWGKSLVGCNGAAARYCRQWIQTGLTPGFTSTLLLTHTEHSNTFMTPPATHKNIRYEEAGQGTRYKQGQRKNTHVTVALASGCRGLREDPT
uniref:Ig-like domain-containing protein n=1 Tax=Gadus morhua TaxID=8049 RepID=A0A8C5AX92_GADMO